MVIIKTHTETKIQCFSDFTSSYQDELQAGDFRCCDFLCDFSLA